jgi:hypothetical protein
MGFELVGSSDTTSIQHTYFGKGKNTLKSEVGIVKAAVKYKKTAEKNQVKEAKLCLALAITCAIKKLERLVKLLVSDTKFSIAVIRQR